MVDQPPPVEAVQPHASNPNGQYARQPAPSCLLPGDVEKFNNLIGANRYDLASKLGCIIIPQGTEVIRLDTIGDLAQIIWEKNGKTIELWSRAYNFEWNFTRHLN